MMFWRIFRLELRVAFRHSAEIANPLWFFLIVITLFPLSIGPEPQLLARIAPGIIWVAALLSSLLALERLFRDDLQDGSLEQLMFVAVPLARRCAGEGDGALDGNRSAVTHPFATGSNATGNGCLWLASDGADAAAGNAYAWLSRCTGCGVDSGT